MALCRERNLEAQQLVSSLVPVDAILFLLQSKSLGTSDIGLRHL
jgi:hypothetical protein